MTIWPPKPGTLRRPAYRSLAEAVVQAIQTGELKHNDRLPTHRNLAYDLGLSVQTVSRAYEELIRRGVIAGEVGRGTFVRGAGSEAKPPYLPENPYGTIIDFSLLKPVFGSIHIEAMRDALRGLADDLPQTTVSSFRPTAALRKYHGTYAKWLKLCGIDLRGQGLLVTNGNTSAMTVALMTALDPGGLIAAEALTHHTLKPLARYLGMRLRGLPADEHGLLPDALDRACTQEAVGAVFLMPAGLGPEARVMPAERRVALTEIARRHDLAIVENDAWGPLQPQRTAPFAVIAPERTFYFTGLTKCIMPGLRIGFLVMPETLESAAANRHLVTSWMATAMPAEIAARLIEGGTAERLLMWQRNALRERNALAASILRGLDFHESPNGLHIWLPLTQTWPEDNFVLQARQHGVAVAPSSAFSVAERIQYNGIRICLGAEAMGPLQSGLQTIARLARSQPEPALLTI